MFRKIIWNPFTETHLISYGIIAFCVNTSRWLLVNRKNSPELIMLLRGSYRTIDLPRIISGISVKERDLLLEIIKKYKITKSYLGKKEEIKESEKSGEEEIKKSEEEKSEIEESEESEKSEIEESEESEESEKSEKSEKSEIEESEKSEGEEEGKGESEKLEEEKTDDLEREEETDELERGEKGMKDLEGSEIEKDVFNKYFDELYYQTINRDNYENYEYAKMRFLRSISHIEILLNNVECETDTEWLFPKGRLMHNEDGLECAQREFYEETGIDISSLPTTIVPTFFKSPFVEIFRGVNNRTYETRCWLFLFNREIKPPFLDKESNEPTEIGNRKWVSMDEAMHLLKPSKRNLLFEALKAISVKN